MCVDPSSSRSQVDDPLRSAQWIGGRRSGWSYDAEVLSLWWYGQRRQPHGVHWKTYVVSLWFSVTGPRLLTSTWAFKLGYESGRGTSLWKSVPIFRRMFLCNDLTFYCLSSIQVCMKMYNLAYKSARGANTQIYSFPMLKTRLLWHSLTPTLVAKAPYAVLYLGLPISHLEWS